MDDEKEIEKLPFHKFCVTIGALPTAYIESMTTAELLHWLCNYLENTVIPTLNNNGDVVTELQTLFTELKNYNEHYFDNLDVQTEINKKLDTMASDGSLWVAFEPFLNNFAKSFNDKIDDQNNKIGEQNNNIKAQNEKIEEQNNKIEKIKGNAPIPVSSIEEMTDNSKIYVNTSDGKWYYYSTDSWKEGGIYQASQLSNNYIETAMIKNKAVTPQKIAFVETTTEEIEINTVNISKYGKKIYDGYYRYDGWVDHTSYMTLIIPVLPNQHFKQYSGNRSGYDKAFFDSDMKLISTLRPDDQTSTDVPIEFDVPDNKNIYFMATACLNDQHKNFYNSLRLITNRNYYLLDKTQIDFKVDTNNINEEAVTKNKVDFLKNTNTNIILNSYNLDYYCDDRKNGGYYSLNGTWSDDENFVSYKLKVNAGDTFKQQASSKQGYYKTFFNKDNEFIEGFTPTTQTDYDTPTEFSVPLDPQIAYMWFCIPVALLNRQEQPYLLITPYNLYKLSNQILIENQTNKINTWNNKIVLFMGDSITEPFRATKAYWNYLAEKINIIPVNYGIGGARISGNGVNAMHKRILTMQKNADMICIFGGTNDFAFNGELGKQFEINSETGEKTINKDTTNFYGAVNFILETLLINYPSTNIVMFTPLHRGVYGNQYTDLQKNALGYYLEDYVNAIRECCEHYSVTCIDLFKISNLSPSVTPQIEKYFFTNDQLHPNNYGHEQLANILIEEFDKIPVKLKVE